MNGMKELLDKYIAAEREKRRAEEELQKAKEAVTQVSEQVLEMFESTGLQNIKLEDGVTIALRTDIRARIPADKQEEAYNIFREHGMDSIIKETIHPKTLESWVREFAGLNGVELPDWARGYVETYEQTRPTILGLK